MSIVSFGVDVADAGDHTHTLRRSATPPVRSSASTTIRASTPAIPADGASWNVSVPLASPTGSLTGDAAARRAIGGSAEEPPPRRLTSSCRAPSRGPDRNGSERRPGCGSSTASRSGVGMAGEPPRRASVARSTARTMGSTRQPRRLDSSVGSGRDGRRDCRAASCSGRVPTARSEPTATTGTVAAASVTQTRGRSTRRRPAAPSSRLEIPSRASCRRDVRLDATQRAPAAHVRLDPRRSSSSTPSSSWPSRDGSTTSPCRPDIPCASPISRSMRPRKYRSTSASRCRCGSAHRASRTAITSGSYSTGPYRWSNVRPAFLSPPRTSTAHQRSRQVRLGIADLLPPPEHLEERLLGELFGHLSRARQQEGEADRRAIPTGEELLELRRGSHCRMSDHLVVTGARGPPKVA